MMKNILVVIYDKITYMIKILDCTTRDGGHCTNWNFDRNFVQNLLDCQNKSDISFYEIGYRNHFDNENKGIFYNCSPEFLKEFYENKGKLKLVIMTDTKRFSIDDFTDGKSDYVDFVRIACHPDRIFETLQIAKELHDRNYGIFVQLMDISNVDESGYSILSKWEYKDILESLYIADSYGTICPQDIEKYFSKLKSIGYKKISFHGHNKSGLALENTLKLIELGAYSVDVTLNGIGRCGGNLDAAQLLGRLNNFNPEHYKSLSFPK